MYCKQFLYKEKATFIECWHALGVLDTFFVSMVTQDSEKLKKRVTNAGLSPVSDIKLSKFSRSRDFSREFSDMCQKHQELRMLRRKVQLTFYILNMRWAETTFYWQDLKALWPTLKFAAEFEMCC